MNNGTVFIGATHNFGIRVSYSKPKKEKPLTKNVIQLLELLKEAGEAGMTLEEIKTKMNKKTESVFTSMMTATLPISYDNGRYYYTNWSER